MHVYIYFFIFVVTISICFILCRKNNKYNKRKYIRGKRFIIFILSWFVLSCFSVNIFNILFIAELFVKSIPALMVIMIKYILREDVDNVKIFGLFVAFSLLALLMGGLFPDDYIRSGFMGIALGCLMWLNERY